MPFVGKQSEQARPNGEEDMTGNGQNSAGPGNSNGHPVADNPLRLLFSAQAESCTVRDMERNAKALKLQARHTAIAPIEPLQDLCPRHRSIEDYALAQKQITDPVQLAVGLFFWPSDFGGKNLMQQANTSLLEAEGLPQGDGRKAELIASAIREFDSLRAGEWLHGAVATAGDMVGTTPDAEAVRAQVGEAVKRVAERAIADFGDTIEPSEIDLLNAIDACSRLPEIHGVVRAGEMVLEKQCGQIAAYITTAYGILSANKGESFATYPAHEIESVVAKCKQAKNALALLKMRPSLLRKMPADYLMHLSTCSAVLAFRLGPILNRWREAAELVHEIDSTLIDPAINTEDRVVYQVACSAVPLVYLAKQGHNVSLELLQLRLRFPRAGKAVDIFTAHATVKATTSPPPLPYGQGKPVAKSNGCSNWGCAGVLIFILIGFLNAIFSDSAKKPNSYPTSPSTTYRVPKSVAGALNQEHAAIEAQNRDMARLHDRVVQMEREIESERLGLDNSNAFAVDQFNRKVNVFNQLIETERRTAIALDNRTSAYNARLRQNAR